MHLLAVILLIIFVLIIAFLVTSAYLDRTYLNNVIIPNLPRLEITPEAKKLFTEYISNYSLSREHEQKCSGIPDITLEPEKYFKIELKEKDHRDIVYLLEQNNWLMNEAIMKLWIQENYRENYIRKKTQCN